MPNGAPANQSVADQTGNFSNYLNSANGAPNTGSSLTNNLQGYNPNVGFDQTHTGTWGQQAADQYMNPYTNSVLHSQEALAHDTYGQQKAALDQNAAASGALGGDRNAVAQSGLDNDFALQEQNLQANALNSAYNNAQTQYNNDQNRQLQSDVTNSQLGLASSIQNAELNYGARAASNQFELGQGNLNLSGLGQAGQAAQLAQGYAQSKNDTDYQNGMMNYLFPEQQISYAQGVLNGTPQQWTQQSDYFLPSQGNPFSQALGAQQAKGSNKGGASGGSPAKSSGGGSGGGNSGGGGFKPPPFTPPGQTQNNVPNPPNLNLPWNTEPDTSGAFTHTPTQPPLNPTAVDSNISYDPYTNNPSFDPSSLGVYQNSSGVDDFGNLIPNFTQQPGQATLDNIVGNDMTGSYLAPSYNGDAYNSGSSNAGQQFDWQNFGGQYSDPNYFGNVDPGVAFSNTGYPYNGNYGDADVYGLYPSDYQMWNGLEEN